MLSPCVCRDKTSRCHVMIGGMSQAKKTHLNKFWHTEITGALQGALYVYIRAVPKHSFGHTLISLCFLWSQIIHRFMIRPAKSELKQNESKPQSSVLAQPWCIVTSHRLWGCLARRHTKYACVCVCVFSLPSEHLVVTAPSTVGRVTLRVSYFVTSCSDLFSMSMSRVNVISSI